ncbi:MAG: alpha/beta hydrolase [Planctomycetota bacterium]
MPWWIRLVLVFGVLGVGLGLAAWFFQRRLEYFPDPSPVPLPHGPAYEGLEAVRLTTADGVRLEAWWWPGTRRGAILLFHGNAGNRGGRLAWMTGLHERGWSVFLPDYRGYGGSGGSPSEAGFAEDADAAVAWLQARGQGPIVYLGSSIGSGVATQLAARHPPAGLVLQSGTISLVPIAQRIYRFLPMGLLLRDPFDLSDVAPRVTCPSLSIHGELDTIVPVELGRRLHDALGGPKTWWEVEGAGHNDVVEVGGRAYDERLDAFLEEVLDRE